VPIARFLRVSKTFGASPAVRDVSFDIRRGEFFSLLGPSGCGKTTTLRLLAGLESPDPGGQIFIAGERAETRRPYERRLGMVFQSYALFPHLSVERNVSFGLERHRVPGAQIPGRVARALELVRLDPAEFARRRPAELSGGQRQRVALARALVLEPEMLLLDEPLGAVDLKLRKTMQLELRQLNRSLGVTFVYVTHDQDEALTMSDRIAVMDRGCIVQLGTPAEVYERPRTSFVATFIGESNLIEGRLRPRDDGAWEVMTPDGHRLVAPHAHHLETDGRALLAVRPEWVDIAPRGQAPSGRNTLDGVVDEVIYTGEMVRVLVTLADPLTAHRSPLTGVGSPLTAHRFTVALRNAGQLAGPLTWSRGDPVSLSWRPEDSRLLEDV
jgi:spermidine/putrescine transport system ATP-binding protein